MRYAGGVRATVVLLSLAITGCTDAPDAPPRLRLTAVTFNTGTTDGLDHEAAPDDGYGAAEAAISDAWYGNGLAWQAAVDDTRRFFEELAPDVVAFQEVFFSPDCEAIPAAHHPGFVCESWTPGDPTVAEVALGAGFQVACHLQKNDKCLAVHERFGTFRGCDGALCLDALDGAEIAGCGGGARVGRGVIDLVAGGRLTVVSVHGSSGFSDEDIACRTKQFDQAFVDLGLGDGAAANGDLNLVLGDFNTDPGRLAALDPSAAALNDHVGDGKRFHFVTAVGADAPPTYLGANIDHVVSDALTGSCTHPGLDGPPVSAMVYFDHRPAVCVLEGG